MLTAHPSSAEGEGAVTSYYHIDILNAPGLSANVLPMLLFIHMTKLDLSKFNWLDLLESERLGEGRSRQGQADLSLKHVIREQLLENVAAIAPPPSE